MEIIVEHIIKNLLTKIYRLKKLTLLYSQIIYRKIIFSQNIMN